MWSLELVIQINFEQDTIVIFNIAVRSDVLFPKKILVLVYVIDFFSFLCFCIFFLLSVSFVFHSVFYVAFFSRPYFFHFVFFCELKGPLTGLEKSLATGSPLKLIKKSF